MKREFLLNSISISATRGLLGGGRSLMLLMALKLMGPEFFGKLALVISLIEVFRFTANFGMDVTLIRRFSKGAINLAGCTVAKIPTSIASYCLLLITVLLVSRGKAGYLPLAAIAGLSIIIFSQSSNYTSALMARMKARFMLICGVASIVTLLLVSLLGKFWVILFALALTLADAAYFLCLRRTSKRAQVPMRLGRWRPRGVKLMLTESLPAALSNTLVILYHRLDVLLLQIFQGELGVAQYCAPARLLDPILLIAGGISTSVYALLSPPGTKVSKARLPIVVSVVIALILAGIIFTFSHPIASFLYPSDTNTFVRVLDILLLAMLFKYVNMHLTSIINSQGKFIWITKLASLNLAVNVLANLLLIPRYGAVGAGSSIALTEGINFMVQTALVRRIG